MQRIVLLLIAIMTMITVNAQTLTERQKGLAACACLMAQGDFGRGWYQEWGKAPVEMTPGSVIAILAEVKHWHGAEKDSWFQHLTYHKDVQEDASNEWCESVADEVYDTLK